LEVTLRALVAAALPAIAQVALETKEAGHVADQLAAERVLDASVRRVLNPISHDFDLSLFLCGIQPTTGESASRGAMKPHSARGVPPSLVDSEISSRFPSRIADQCARASPERRCRRRKFSRWRRCGRRSVRRR